MLGPALASAIASLRARLGDPTAPIAILTPSAVNGTLARRELAFATPFIRVEMWTPAELEGVLAEEGLRRAGKVVEPAGWSRATVARIVREDALPGGYEEVLREPGWTAALVSALRALEGGQVTAAELSRITLPAGLSERSLALAHLLGRVAQARAAEGIAGPIEVADAALLAAREGSLGPGNVARGAILLGDARIARTTFEVLSAWLAARPVVRIDPAELAALSPERHGLTAAAPHAEVVALAARAPEVSLVRTPDPTRELAEAVREAQAAIVRGVPLDRIAIVLPDPNEASSLADALARASIPATWQTGPALAQTPAARFLMHAIELALGEGGAGNTVVRWYDLLRQNELRLRAVLGENGSRGRGRWRRLLHKSGAIQGTARIVREVERLRDEAREDETADQKDARLAAIDALALAIRTLSAELEELRTERSVGAHARALRLFLRRWWTPSPDQQFLARLLEGWGRSSRGPVIGLGELSATLEETLEATEMLSGSLKDPSIRVLSPMQLLGAELDVVLVTGMTEGRFPARPREDAVLSDAILDALDRVTPAHLFRSHDRVHLEKRRLAAIRSAARSQLWLSAPAVELLEARPLLPGSLLLAIASERAGRRVGPAELERTMKATGRRSRAWPADPSAALGGLEHLLSRLHGTDIGARTRALEALLDHVLSRRLTTAEHARARLEGELSAAHAEDATLRAYAGFVDPAILACRGLDSTPLSASELVQLLAQPEAFFLRRMLGAWRAPRLRDGWDPIAGWWVEQTLVAETRTVLERREDADRRLREAFDTRTAEELERTGVGDADARSRLGRMAERAISALLRTDPPPGPIHELDAAPLADDLPWRLRGGDARVIGAGLHWIVTETPGARSLHKAVAPLLEAIARGGPRRFPVLTFHDVRGDRAEFDQKVPDAVASTLSTLRLATSTVRAGFFPAALPEPASLAVWGIVDASGGDA